MDIRELRVGNFVVANNKGWAIGLIDYFKNEVILYNIGMPDIKSTFKIKDIEPIEVSVEWLDCFNIKYDVDDKYEGYYYGLGCLEYKYSYEQVDISIECDYIHQLQNIYFALKGEELELNNDK